MPKRMEVNEEMQFQVNAGCNADHSPEDDSETLIHIGCGGRLIKSPDSDYYTCEECGEENLNRLGFVYMR